MTAVSQWEREAIGERTRDAMNHKRTNGERVGNIQFGYRLGADGKHVEADPAEQEALSEIRRLRNQGATLRGIAATLNQQGPSDPPRYTLAPGISRQSGQPNQLSIRTILPSTEPVAKHSMACLASRSAKVRVTSGSIFFSVRSAKILGRSSRSGFGSFRYSAVIP